MKKVCHINTTFIHKAAATRRTFAVLRAMADSDYEVVQITGREFEPNPAWDLSGIVFERVDDLVKYIKPASDVSALRSIYGLLKKHKPHLVHTHLAKAGILGRIAAKLAGVPTIVHTVQGPTFAENIHPTKKMLFKNMEWVCGRFTDYFVFVGEELRNEYVRNGVCLVEKAKVIRGGRPTSEFDALDRLTYADLSKIRGELVGSEAGFLIGYVGRLVPSKAQDKAIEVLKLVRERGIDAHLVLVGEGLLGEEKGYESFLRKRATELGLADFVHFAGYRPDALACMKAMDVLVMTSKYEGLPNVAVEAGISGRPMVAFDVCGIKEVINDGDTGFVIRYGDIHGMVEKLTSLARDPAMAERIGAEASKQVRERYNMERMVREKLLFYEDILRS